MRLSSQQFTVNSGACDKVFIFSSFQKIRVIFCCCTVYDESDMVIELELADVFLLKKFWLTGLKLGCKFILTILDRRFAAQNNGVWQAGCFKKCVGGFTKACYYVQAFWLNTACEPTGNAENYAGLTVYSSKQFCCTALRYISDLFCPISTSIAFRSSGQ